MLEGKSEIKLLSTVDKDASAWKRLFCELQEQDQDIHFSVEYARAYKRAYGCDVLLAVYCAGDSYVLMPFVLRDVRQLPFMACIDGPVYDIANLYAFGGPVARIGETRSSRELHSDFHLAFSNYCRTNRIVTQFTAFHPLLENHRGLQETGLVEVKRRKEVVWIDLGDSESKIFQNISRNHARSIRRARQLGVETGPLQWDASAISQFNELYRLKMQAVKANARWHLPESYCEDCIATLGPDRVSLFNATQDGRVLASAITLMSNNTAYHHFIGATDDAQRACAHHLLIYELAYWAKARGCQRLVLGGGLEQRDGIFRFKAGFSESRSWFYTANVVYDERLYRQLCEARDNWNKMRGVQPGSIDFFPQYRANAALTSLEHV